MLSRNTARRIINKEGIKEVEALIIQVLDNSCDVRSVPLRERGLKIWE